MSSKYDERVLVVPSSELDRLGRFQGFSPEVDHYLTGLLIPELIQFLPRSEGGGGSLVEADHSVCRLPMAVTQCAFAARY